MLKLFALFAALTSSLAFAGIISMENLGSDFVPVAGHPNGSIAGYKKSTNQAAVRLNDGTIHDIGTLGGLTSRSTSLSPDGTEVLGGADNANGVRNAFVYNIASGTITSLFAASPAVNEAIGMDSAGNIVVNFDAGSPLVVRKNQDGTVDTLDSDIVASGINAAGIVVGSDTGTGDGFFYNGSTNFILPSGYAPSAGISDTNLTAGQLGGTLAAFFEIGDPMAQLIPNIFTLGPLSEVTGVTDVDLLFGDVGSTVFSYDIATDTLVDLNTETFIGDPVNLLQPLDDLFGSSVDGSFFFGEYTPPGTTITNYYKAKPGIIVPEPSTIMMIVGPFKVIAQGIDQNELEDEKEDFPDEEDDHE